MVGVRAERPTRQPIQDPWLKRAPTQDFARALIARPRCAERSGATRNDDLREVGTSRSPLRLTGICINQSPTAPRGEDGGLFLLCNLT